MKINIIGNALLGITLLLSPLAASQLQTPPVAKRDMVLVRIDPGGEAAIAALIALDLPLYEQLYSAESQPYLLAAADLLAIQALTGQGFVVTILDPQIASSGYTLLYGSASNLEKAGSAADLLLVEGSFGLARGTVEQNGVLAALGLDLTPLVERPRIVPPAQPRTAAMPAAITPSTLVQEMVSQLKSSDLYDLVGGLSGEHPVQVDGQPYTILTRYTYTTTPLNKATRYAYERFQSLGLTTWYDYYPIAGYEKRNVLAQQVGLTHPERIVLLTAHLDSTSFVNGSPNNYAPGADDNASGSAALLRIAEILSQYGFGCTLRYALFTGEEQGMIGSQAYAADVFSAREDVRGVLNIDMLGYSTPASTPRFELHTRPGNSGDLTIANLFKDAVQAYGLALTPRIMQDGKTFSDHSSFWYYNYPAILAIEDWDDHTPFYHQTGDKLETLNFAYYTEFAKAALATFAHMGCLLGRISGTLTDAASAAPIQGARVEAWRDGALARSATTGAGGRYSLALPPGSYTIRMRAQDYLGQDFTGVTLADGGTLALNGELTYCAFVRETTLLASNPLPELGETVYFSATVSGGEPPISFQWDFGDGESASDAFVNHAYNLRGAYPVTLTTSNACGVPQTRAAAIYVDVELTFLPRAAKP